MFGIALLFFFSSSSQEVKVIPETAQYRVSVGTLTNQRLAVVSKEDLSPEKMEEEIGAGQLEELIIQAKDELSLIPKMAGKMALQCQVDRERDDDTTRINRLLVVL